MSEIFSNLSLSIIDWFLIFICAMLIGMSKTGVPGVTMLAVPVLAFIFGAKQSTGVLLPIMNIADLFAVAYYSRHAQWKHLFRALPWALIGILSAVWVGNRINNEQFKDVIAITVFVSVGIMIWRDYIAKKEAIPDKWWFGALMGVSGGFASMIGNVAGPILAIYLLAMHLDKKSFIGTTAWFFCIVNLTKLPFQAFAWNNIHLNTILVDILSIPAIALGAWLGVQLVKKISEDYYKWFVIIITVLSAFLILI